jgi:hypothetical protein
MKIMLWSRDIFTLILTTELCGGVTTHEYTALPHHISRQSHFLQRLCISQNFIKEMFFSLLIKELRGGVQRCKYPYHVGTSYSIVITSIKHAKLYSEKPYLYTLHTTISYTIL